MEWAVWVGFTLVVIGAVVGIFYWGGFSRMVPMTRTREGLWIVAFICLTMAISRLLTLRATLWPQLGIRGLVHALGVACVTGPRALATPPARS